MKPNRIVCDLLCAIAILATVLVGCDARVKFASSEVGGSGASRTITLTTNAILSMPDQIEALVHDSFKNGLDLGYACALLGGTTNDLHLIGLAERIGTPDATELFKNLRARQVRTLKPEVVP